MQTLKKYLIRWTEPSPMIIDPMDRKIAHFIAGYHLLTSPIGFLATFIYSYTKPNTQLPISWVLGTILVAGLNYLLARSKFFYWGIYLQLLMVLVFLSVTAYLIPDRQSIHFTFLIPILLAGILMSFRAILVVWLATLINLFALWLVYHPDNRPLLVGSVFVMQVMAALIVYMRYYRNSVEELKRTQLTNQQQRFFDMFDASFDGVCLVIDNCIQKPNTGFGRVFDVSIMKLEGSMIGEVLPKYLFTEKGRCTNTTYTRTNGDIRYLQMFQEHSATSEIFVAVRDITEFQEIQTKKLVLERISSVATLSLGIAHELNSPLMIAMNHSQSILETLQKRFPNEDFTHITKNLLETNESLLLCSEILNDLKWFVQLNESSTEKPNEVIEKTIRLVSHRIGHKTQVSFLPQEYTAISISELKLSQILINLLLNASEAQKKGTTGNLITLRSSVQNNRFRIIITDNGIGIPKHLQSRVFEPFFTKKEQGTGLGLAICQYLVQSSDGSIWFESQENQGCTFFLEFPVVQIKSKSKTNNKELSVKKMLVVDDNPNLRDIISNMLPSIQTTSVGSVDKAITFLEQEKTDIILCDVIMPDKGGIDLYQYCTEHPLQNNPKIIFITGGIVDPHVQRFISHHGIPILYKPFTSKNLRNHIYDVLE